MKNPVELENHVSRLMHDTGFERDVLLRQIGVDAASISPQTAAVSAQQKPKVPFRRKTSVPDYEKAEQQLLSMLVRGLLPADVIRAKDFSVPLNGRIFELLQNGTSINLNIFRSLVINGEKTYFELVDGMIRLVYFE